MFKKSKYSNVDGFVYVLEDRCNRIMKIGRTTMPNKRINDLQRQAAFPLELVQMFYCKKHGMVENALKFRLNKFHFYGEWYVMNENSKYILNSYFKLLDEKYIKEIKSDSDAKWNLKRINISAIFWTQRLRDLEKGAHTDKVIRVLEKRMQMCKEYLEEIKGGNQ